MSDPTPARSPSDLSRLALPGGAFAMLAIDQRISLETMFEAAGRPVELDGLDAFRAAVLSELAPDASAVLVERGLVERGRFPELRGGARPGRILAGELLIQQRGHAATGSTIDPDAPAVARLLDADALKLMAIHTLGTPLEPVHALIAAFVAGAHAAGLPAVVEGIVRADAGAAVTADGFLASTAAMAAGADLYKAQTPIFGGTDDASIRALSADISAALACPWVVLSTGVAEDAFPAAVAAACQGGASGFLAGRGIWGSTVGAADVTGALRGPARERLLRLKEIVVAEARPWQDVAGTSRPEEA